MSVRFFPDAGENNAPVIHLEPKQGTNKQILRSIKEKMETILNVKNSGFSKQNGKPVFTITLDEKTNPSTVEEFLRSMFHGGEVENDSFSIEDDNEEQEQQSPVPDAQQAAPAIAQDQMQIQPEGLVTHAYNLFFESTYRTGKYWEVLSKATGKSKQAIDENTVLSLRRQYTRKPKGKRRDEVLRSLDKAMRYFARKIRKEQTPQAADEFKNKYRSIGDLVPTDYKDGSHLEPEPEQNSAFPQGGFETQQAASPNVDLNISDLFGSDEDEEEDEEDAYENFEIEE